MLASHVLEVGGDRGMARIVGERSGDEHLRVGLAVLRIQGRRGEDQRETSCIGSQPLTAM